MTDNNLSNELNNDMDNTDKGIDNTNSSDSPISEGRKKSNSNLIPMNKLSENEQRLMASRGGKKSGEVRRAKKNARELLQTILTKDMTDEQIEEVLGTASVLLGNDKTAYNVLMVKLLQLAMQGDLKSILAIRDTVGDAPIQKTEIKAEITDNDKQLLDNLRDSLKSII